MAWPKTLTAEEILGMKPDELKSKLDSSVTKDDLTEALKPVEEIKGSLAALRESLASLTRQPEPVIPTEEGDPAVNLLADPKKFVAGETAELRRNQLQTNAQLAELKARQNPEYAGLFRQYGAEIDALVAKVPLETRALPQFWDSSLRTFLGNKFIKGEIRQNNFPTLLGTSSVGPRGDGDTEDTNLGFDPEMAQFFKSRGRDLKEMAWLRDRMNRDGDTLTHEAWSKRPH